MTHRNDTLYSDAVAITPSDTVIQNVSGLYIGVTGDVTIKGASGVAVLFKAVPAGTILPIVAAFVMSTGTTATNIAGLIP